MPPYAAIGQVFAPYRPGGREAATPSPGRFSLNPVVLRLIVVLSTIVTGRIVRWRQWEDVRALYRTQEVWPCCRL